MIKIGIKGGASDLIQSVVIYLVLIALFISPLMFFVSRTGSNAAFYEQKYAKEISMFIDSSLPGTTISINLNEIKDFLENNPNAFSFEDNKVSVKLKQLSTGYSFPYFSDYKIEKSLENNDNQLYLKISIMKNE